MGDTWQDNKLLSYGPRSKTNLCQIWFIQNILHDLNMIRSCRILSTSCVDHELVNKKVPALC